MEIKLFDYDKALERFMGEEEILLEVLEPYLESLDKSVEELRQLDPKEQGQRIREVAHSIKGSSLNLDIIPLGELAETLEDLAYEGKTKSIPGVIKDVLESAKATSLEVRTYIK